MTAAVDIRDHEGLCATVDFFGGVGVAELSVRQRDEPVPPACAGMIEIAEVQRDFARRPCLARRPDSKCAVRSAVASQASCCG